MLSTCDVTDIQTTAPGHGAAFDMLDLYSRVQCPVLIVNGTAAELGAGPEWIKELMAAYRKGIERDLEELAGRQRNVRVVNLPASHALV